MDYCVFTYHLYPTYLDTTKCWFYLLSAPYWVTQVRCMRMERSAEESLQGGGLGDDGASLRPIVSRFRVLRVHVE